MSKEYIAVTIHLAGKTACKDILPSLLDEYMGFLEEPDSLIAYVEKSLFDEERLRSLLASLSCEDLAYTVSVLQEKNWNALWEHSFEPVVVDDQILIKASFHTNTKPYPYTIQIDPKMSFGTGHHDTTRLMLSLLLKEELHGLSVADVGCGTGVLSIFSALQGASSVDACDIDEWSVSNTIENLALNQVEKVRVVLGPIQKMLPAKYDILLANINKNVLTTDLGLYASCLNVGGKIVLSGFFADEVSDVLAEANNWGLVFRKELVSGEWAALLLSQK